TIYNVGEYDTFANGVPIGRPVNNSGAYIMDTQQQLVPLGVMGELVVTGDGLARGYTDPLMDLGRFVKVAVDGQLMRAYRTGDRARYRPKDGQIEFFGRMDHQVKVRGHRIEPAEVEQAMLSHGHVRDAAVVVRVQEGGEPEMVGFVVAEEDKLIQEDDKLVKHKDARSQVEGWGDHFEMSTYTNIKTIAPSEIGTDFMGWTSMYDESEIDKAEMREWLDDTMRTLLDGHAAGHVLEIGTGTGMVLFNLGKGLKSYVGLDPSSSAAAFVNNTIKSIPALEGRAEVHVGTATDVARVDGLRPDVVVFNSVVQYFPTPEYLTEVIDALTRIPGVKRLFFGDIRTHAINRDFLAARALRVLGGKATKAGLLRKMAELEEREEELLVGPAFFTGLKGQLPGRIRHVEILPKRMRATNELSSYRYTAVVHLCGEQETQPVHEIDADAWVDFGASHMDRQALLRLLQDSPDATAVAVGNIAYDKTIVERHVVRSLDGHDDDALDGAAWVLAFRSRAELCPSLSATDLVQLGEEAGFRVEISWARQHSQNGALDAVFHHYQPAKEEARVMIHFPTDDQGPSPGSPTRHPTNRPLQRLQSRRIETQIRKRLQTLLPAYMVPTQIIARREMPVNGNGKVDRRDLSQRARAALAVSTGGGEATSALAAPSNEVEAAL
ncbi:AMP-binding protein, partial [Candidatus Bathyarchaeota archaeon]|nr:AMP-binding protein [Candidatus Bathyarchaeota archaeon]